MTIFNFASMRQVGTPEFSVFGAEFDVDAANFVTNLPDLDFYSWVTQIDPALGKAFPANAFPTPVGDIDLGNLGYTAYAQFCSTVRAVRMVLGQLASTVGFLRSSLGALTEVFKGPVTAIGNALNVGMERSVISRSGLWHPAQPVFSLSKSAFPFFSSPYSPPDVTTMPGFRLRRTIRFRRRTSPCRTSPRGAGIRPCVSSRTS